MSQSTAAENLVRPAPPTLSVAEFEYAVAHARETADWSFLKTLKPNDEELTLLDIECVSFSIFRR